MVLTNLPYLFYIIIELLTKIPFILLFTIILSTIISNINLSIYYKKILSTIIISLNFLILITFLILSFLKVFLLIFLTKNLLISEIIISQGFFKFFSLETVNSYLSDAIILLAYTSGFICLKLLGERNLSRYLPNINFFSIFILFTTTMVYTSNILVMFLSFEFIFIPTIYFAYTLGYTKKVDKALSYLFLWTLTGAFLVLCVLGYIYIQYKTLEYYQLLKLPFTSNELEILGLLIFLGFSAKVPVFPFHFWLTKIHVEAPAGFSIFLSGFLVKAAIYCLFILLNIFYTTTLFKLILFISIISIIESSCKLWTQTDIKKTIAFATIQEMNIILLLLVTFNNNLNYIIIFFILMHGWLSTLMFFLIDVIQKKLGSRNILCIGGISSHVPKLKNYIWIMLIFMSGFPLTIKFVVEALLINTLITSSFTISGIILIAAIIVGVLGFFRQFLIVLYNENQNSKKISSIISKRDQYIFNFTLSLLISLNFILFFLY